MKQLFLFTICFFGFAVYGKTQQDAIKVILENDKLKVTEYTSTPGKDVCGKGKHTHAPHLSILLTDAIVRQTTPDGKIQDFDLKKEHYRQLGLPSSFNHIEVASGQDPGGW